MPESKSSRVKTRQQSERHHTSPAATKEQSKASTKNDSLPGSPNGRIGGDFSEATFERYVALLSDPHISHPMYEQQRATIIGQIQRDYGNGYVRRLIDQISQMRAEAVQGKLTVGPAGDKYEQEADRVAEQVTEAVSSSGQEVAQRQPPEEEELQMKPMAQRQVPLEGGDLNSEVENTLQQARGAGQALPKKLRSSMEGAFGADFSGVRVHTGPVADDLNESMSARAFTTDRDIFVKGGEYNPGSPTGRELLAHELTHVVQQNGDLVAEQGNTANPNLVQRDDDEAVVDVGGQSIWGTLWNGITATTTAIGGTISSGYNTVVSTFSGGVNALASGVSKVAEVVEYIATDPVGALTYGATRGAQGLVQVANIVASSVAKGAQAVAGGVKTGAEQLIGGTVAAVMSVANASKQASLAMAGVGRDLADAMVSLTLSVADSAKSAGLQAIGVAKKSADALVNLTISAGQTVVGATKTAIGALSSLIATTGKIVVSAVTTLTNKLVEVAKVAGGLIADGAKALVNTIVALAKWALPLLQDQVKSKIYTGEFMELNASQYRVSGSAKDDEGNWLVEKVVRREEDGKPVYYAEGIITDFGSDSGFPKIDLYDEPKSLGDWAPRVTHINGMSVKPTEGIASAVKLHEELRNSLDSTDDAAVETDVLFTYSATRGLVTDLLECLKGKLYIGDDATKMQEQIMLDAVDTQSRTTVSAHSRGTIKTDNAVLNVHKMIRLRPDLFDTAYISPEAMAIGQEAYQDVVSEVDIFKGALLNPEVARDIAQMEYAQQEAYREASRLMDTYIQLIYAGNAVQFPSTKVKGHLVVAKADPITIGVGKYFRWAKPANMEMTDVPGGHGFDENYAKTVAETIAKDLKDELGI